MFLILDDGVKTQLLRFFADHHMLESSVAEYHNFTREMQRPLVNVQQKKTIWPRIPPMNSNNSSYDSVYELGMTL